MTRIIIEAVVKPTESPTKVRAAILNIFPDAQFAEQEGVIAAESSSLERLKDLLRIQRIRDAARRILRDAATESGIRFSLNKQAAFVGKANFAPPSAMGGIDVTIEDEGTESAIEYLTEKPGERSGQKDCNQRT